MKILKTRTITMRLAPHEKEALDTLADKANKSVARLICWLAFDVLPELERMKKGLLDPKK